MPQKRYRPEEIIAKLRERVEHIVVRHPPLYPDGQALAGVLVDHCEQTELSAVTRRLADNVIGPDVVLMLGPKTDAGTIRKPQSASLGVFGGHLETFSPPDALHTFGVHLPAGLSKEISDPPVSIATEPAGQSDDGHGKCVLIGPYLGLVALTGTMLTKNSASSAFGDMQPLTD